MIYGLANAMPEDKYSYKPTPAQQSFGERVLHVAQVNLMLLQALGAKTPVPAIDMNTASKAAAVAALERVGEYGVAVIKELGEPGLQARIEGEPPTGAVFSHGAFRGHLWAVGCVRPDERHCPAREPPALAQLLICRMRSAKRCKLDSAPGYFLV